MATASTFVEPVRSTTHPAYRYRAAGKSDSPAEQAAGYVVKRFETMEEEAEAEALEEGQQWFNNPALKAEKPGASAEDIAADFEAELAKLQDQNSSLKMSNLTLTKQVQGLTAELDSVKGDLTATEADLEAANKDLAALKADPKIAKILAKAE